MVTKTQQVDMGFGLPEKKKKEKKKGIKEPEIQYSVLKDGYFTEASPRRSTCPSKNVVQAPEMPLVKKKKKKKKKVLSEDHPDPETVLPVRQTRKSPSSQNQAPSHAELHSREKKKKGVALSALAVSHGLGVETSLNPRKGGDGTTADKKLKKHKKDKKAQNPMAFSAQKPRPSETGVALCTCSCTLGQDGEKLATSGQKRKQGSPREQHVKMKKKRRLSQDGDLPLGCLEVIRSVENSPKKGSKKKAAKTEVLDYIPIGEDPKTPVKKKTKSKKQAEEADTEEPALKKKRKKKKENRVTEESCKEESDPDLEVVLEKKGNMDEAHIDQVRRKALQEEIDRESGKTEASETKKWTALRCSEKNFRFGSNALISSPGSLRLKGTKFGQWDTAGFENEDQKLKFLKLMGGLKNLSPSLRRPPSTPDRPNMALSRRAADALQRDLQRDYERALSWKRRRGAGLGFAAAPGRVFYIDRNASRSYKFEN